MLNGSGSLVLSSKMSLCEIDAGAVAVKITLKVVSYGGPRVLGCIVGCV